MKGLAFRGSLIGMAFALVCSAGGVARAQDAMDIKPLFTRDALFVSQAIGWALEGPVSAKEAAPVAFTGSALPKPIATGTMFTRSVMLTDYETATDAPNRRGLSGVIELADRAGHRVTARFETDYVIAGSTFQVNAVDIHELPPDTPLVEAYMVPMAAAGGLAGKSPFAMLEAIRKSAVDPAKPDASPQQYQVYLVGMDRLDPQADLGFSAIDATTGRTIGKSRSVRQNGWVIASLPARFAMNGPGGVYFPVVYRPDGTAKSERITLLFSNRFEGPGGPTAVAPAAKPGQPSAAAPLPSTPALSAEGQAFIAKSYANAVGDQPVALGPCGAGVPAAQLPEDVRALSAAVDGQIAFQPPVKVAGAALTGAAAMHNQLPWLKTEGFGLAASQFCTNKNIVAVGRSQAAGRLDYADGLGRDAGFYWVAQYRQTSSGRSIEQLTVAPAFDPAPRLHLALIPVGMLPGGKFPPITSYRELAELVARTAVSPGALPSAKGEYFIVLSSLDPISTTAKLELKISDEAAGTEGDDRGAAQTLLSSWGLTVQRGTLDLGRYPDLYAKAVFTPGLEAGQAPRKPTLIGVFSLKPARS